MSVTRIKLQQNRLLLNCEISQLSDSMTIDDNQHSELEALLQRYRSLPRMQAQQTTLQALGEDLYHWLDRQQWLTRIIEHNPNPPWIVEFQLAQTPKTPLEQTFTQAPWEILADNNGFLAGRMSLQYAPLRRIGLKTDISPPQPYRLALVFMAAAPEGVNQLDFEAEENAILDAVGGIRQNQLDLYVEESGNLCQLAQELQRVQGTDVLHLSCHGSDASPPCLILENDFGEPEQVNAMALLKNLRNHRPRLLFLSACHTAAQNSIQATEQSNHLALAILEAGIPAILGWASAVGDNDASRFAAHLYRELSQNASLQHAFAQARFDLLNPDLGQAVAHDWHLARLYLRSEGGGLLTNGNASRHRHRADLGQKEFFGAKQDNNLVASREEFVGRRRQIQHILKAWRQGTHGVLIHGMGRQGKSSLAARIANRMQQHKLVVIYGQYRAADLLTQISQAFLNHAEIQSLTARYQSEMQDNPARLSHFLSQLITGPLQTASDDNPALLLVIDDLEQILQPDPRANDRHQITDSHHRETIKAVLQAFHHADQTNCRLLLTSRFIFSLLEQDRDWVEILHTESLPSMQRVESKKQIKQKQAAHSDYAELDYGKQQACIEAAGGNPGLQDWLFKLAMQSPVQFESTLQALQSYRKQGTYSDQEALNNWLEPLNLKYLLGLLSNSQTELLNYCCLFDIPVPVSVARNLMSEFGINPTSWQRLIDLGLCDIYPQSNSHAFLINPLVRPLVGRLSETDRKQLTQLCLSVLWQSWQPQPDFEQALQLLRLALSVKNTEIIQVCADDALYYLVNVLSHQGQAEILADALFELTQTDNLTWSASIWRRFGEIYTDTPNKVEKVKQCLQQALEQAQQDQLDEMEIAHIRLILARFLTRQGEIDEALGYFEEILKVSKEQNQAKNYAVTLGDIARIKTAKGEIEAAL